MRVNEEAGPRRHEREKEARSFTEAQVEDRDGSRQTKGETGEGGKEGLNPYGMAGRVGWEQYIKRVGASAEAYLSRPFG